MTYDDAEEIRGLATRHGFDMRRVPMKSTHHAEMLELLIGRDLGWVPVAPGSTASTRQLTLQVEGVPTPPRN